MAGSMFGYSMIEKVLFHPPFLDRAALWLVAYFAV